MATYTIMIIATMVFTQAFSATEVNPNSIGGTAQSPTNMTYEELVYILQARQGVPQEARTLSPCARAILGCCKENRMNEQCSESLNCGAFFFDINPCDERFVIDALKAAKNFYQQFKQ
ncbi:hadley [Anticarsia gemmatalis]|uniref:hadley n=1 Tax=Anticarsia gemmatalis TaxID=129554 RepID=UPI003F77179F